MTKLYTKIIGHGFIRIGWSSASRLCFHYHKTYILLQVWKFLFVVNKDNRDV